MQPESLSPSDCGGGHATKALSVDEARRRLLDEVAPVRGVAWASRASRCTCTRTCTRPMRNETGSSA